jgi:hypothetical protein
MASKKIEEERRELASALLRAGKSYREVAEALQMGISSVHRISKEPREALAPLVDELKSRFSARYYLLADYILGRISDSSIIDASLKERAIAAAILTDKAMQLERHGLGRRKAAPENPDENPDESPDGTDTEHPFPPETPQE